jgi:peptidoglycan-N-acetylglucosamine deacetylase
MSPARSAAPAIVAAAAAGLMAGVVAQALPAAAAWPGLRAAIAPGTAGIGPAGHIALTFDDGPHRLSTPHFLDLLAERRVRATFFMLGEQIVRAPALAREVLAAGHEIALHGYEHRCLLFRTPTATVADLRRGYDVVTDTLGVRPRWWRPPYGVLTTAALATAKYLGMRPMLWTAWGKDWTWSATPESVVATVNRSLRGGGTVLLHDSDLPGAPGSWQATLGAVPILLDRIEASGWQVGPLATHFPSPIG